MASPSWRRRLGLVALAAAVAVALGEGPPPDDAAPNAEFVVRRNAARELVHGIDAVRSGGDTGLEVQPGTEGGEGGARASSEAAG